MTQARDGAEPGRLFARWLADQADAALDAPLLDAGRLLLQLRANRAFLRHVESAGTSVAERGGSLSGLLATALERMGALGAAVLRGANREQHEAIVDQLVQLQTAAVQSLVRGYDAIVPINATPTERERLLDNMVRALDRINSVINSSLELDEILMATVESISDLLGVSEVTIYLYDEAIDRLILSATRGFNPEAVGQTTLALGEGIIGWAAQVGQPVAVRDAWSDPRFKYVPGLGEEDLRSFLVVPIVIFTVERLIGVLSMGSPQFRDFTDEEVRFAEITAGQLAIAVENARLHGQTDDALRGKIEQLTTVQNLARTLTSDLEPGSVLAQIAQTAADLIGVDKAAIWQVDEDGKRMRIVAAYNLGDAYRQHSLRIGDGVVGRAVATRAPVVVNDAMNDQADGRNPRTDRHRRLQRAVQRAAHPARPRRRRDQPLQPHAPRIHAGTGGPRLHLRQPRSHRHRKRPPLRRGPPGARNQIHPAPGNAPPRQEQHADHRLPARNAGPSHRNPGSLHPAQAQRRTHRRHGARPRPALTGRHRTDHRPPDH